MALRLVNTDPGESTDPIKPGQTVHLGLKSETLKVQLASVYASMGLSNVMHHNLLPENDTKLQDLEAVVSLETSERRRPIDGTTSRSISGGNLVFTKNNTANGELGIYEIKIPIKQASSCLAYFKFKTKTGWAAFSADWCDLSNMTGMYFGLEHGTFNTAAYVFLRADSVDGSLVVGGPLQAYNTTRPGQVEILPSAPHSSTVGFPWLSLPDNSSVEVYIYFNVIGYSDAPASGVPINTPLVEIWTRIPSQPGPVIQAYIPVGSFEEFPSSTATPAFTNSRSGPTEAATIFFGNISRTSGTDSLELEDWALFPDYRVAIKDGAPRPKHTFVALPDSPIEYHAKDNKLPTETVPGRWFPETGGGWITPSQTLFFQPGRRSSPIYLSLEKNNLVSLSALHKTEPKFEERQYGVMIEALISGEALAKVGDGTGMGFCIDDGDKIYQILMVEVAAQRYFALCKDTSSLDSQFGYHLPSEESDFTSLKLVKLVIDRLRPSSIGGGKAQLYIDDQLVLTKDLSSDTFPASLSSVGMVRFGHLALIGARSRFNLASITYLQRYLAWEGVDLLIPSDAGLDSNIQFSLNSSGSGSSTIVDAELVLEKSSLGGSTKRTFSKAQPFSEIDGMMIDFRMAIDRYADSNGTLFVTNIDSGVSLDIYLGNKKVSVGFYDCGPHGKMIGILPANGDTSEIIEQSDLGRARSARVNWNEMTSYRLVVKGHDRVDLIIGSSINSPSISLPWVNDTDGFELPDDVSSPKIEFGHINSDTTSKSRWQYIRWGSSNGFEVAVSQMFPEEHPKYIFEGQALIRTEFDEA